MRAIRKQAGRVLYQAVRFEGPTAKGVSNFNTVANVTDKAGYLKALDQLRVLFDSAGLKDVKIAAFRVLAGRTDHTHRITISSPTPERAAVFMDIMATNQQLADRIASSAKFRTVVSNTPSRELTK